MLEIVVPDSEYYDSEMQEFIPVRGTSLKLEHSLVSLSKWESKWQIPFLKPKLVMTPKQSMFYIKCMTITQNVNPLIFSILHRDKLRLIYDYIEAPMTATTISSINKNKPGREIITSEVIYYWMTVYSIPFEECQKWHLNRLLTLISVCNLKSSPGKKIPKAELNRRNNELNAQRLKALGTKG